MTVYVDASAIMPLLVPEARTEQMIALLRRDDLGMSELAAGEVCAGLTRRMRERGLTVEEYRSRIARLERYKRVWRQLPMIEEDLRAGVALVQRLELGLRMPDATHLACSARLATVMLTFDQGLRRAAEAVGVPLLEGSA